MAGRIIYPHPPPPNASPHKPTPPPIPPQGMALQEAFDLLAAAHPSINVNPGFLSQLHFLTALGFDSPEYRLLTYKNGTVFAEFESPRIVFCGYVCMYNAYT